MDDAKIWTPSGVTRRHRDDYKDDEFNKTVKDEQDLNGDQQQFTIRTNKPLYCADPDCKQPITTDVPFMILSIPNRGAILMHMLCMGINVSPSEMQDPNWISHVRKRFIDKFMTDKLYGRRTVD